MNDDNYFMNIAYKEALKAFNKNEIPVGAVIVRNNEIVSKGHNLRDSKQVITKHAEIIAIEKANIKLNNWRLLDCVLYTTLEPCPMCKEVIKATKISKVVYGAKNNVIDSNIEAKQINNKIIIDNCEKIIKDAFTNIRNK
ncbi:MAG: nucleoside deaminase [Bacilli bacterium]|nr:nucleoside deaminase [Bacilli bacterium]